MNKTTVTSIQPTQMKKVGNVWITPPAITDPKKRLAALQQAFGMWKNRKPDPIQELEKMRVKDEIHSKSLEKLWKRLSR